VSAADDWLEELPLSPGPPFLRMGVQPLDLDRWLIADEQRDAELALRRRLLAERHDEVFAALPGTEEAGAEVLELVADAVGAPPPPASDVHPLERAGTLAQEDLCLMTESDEGLVLGAAVLCFPSHWSLGDKIGRPTAMVHGPVPRYDPELRTKVDTFLTRLRPDRPVWRRNWTIHDHDELFAPAPPPPRPLDPARLGDELVVRSERQTLRRLPRSGAVLFTIKTQQVPLGALQARPLVAARLAATIRSLPPEHLAGRAFGRFHAEILTWLDAAA
jgi:hypothetical protein